MESNTNYVIMVTIDWHRIASFVSDSYTFETLTLMMHKKSLSLKMF